MRWLFAILFILLGSILLSLTINDMGNAGHIIMKTIGFVCFIFAVLIVKSKKDKQKKE
ncbi:hypothetical protein [Bacillus sp. CHD6a]|uniref:hypothetical protein n=1 Tax=Bacillus sp. CHD6a TaxID=1643452 RepID=UPI000AD35541|nr:hypothetical protein [Bacillus sp. CHD6a]